MTKKEETITDPFEGFSILDGPFDQKSSEESAEESTKTSVVKDSTEEVEDTELSEEEEKALLEAAKKQEEAAKGKSKEDSTEKVEDKSEESTNEFSFKPFVEHLSEEGLLDYDPEDFEDSIDGFGKVVYKTAQTLIKQEDEALGEEFIKFREFLKSGGKAKDFLETYYSNNSWENFSVESEDNQKKAIREGLKLAGWEEDAIEEELTDIEDMGKLETKAKFHLTKLQKNESKTKEQLVENQKKIAEQQAEEAKQVWDNLKKSIDTSDELNGFKLTPKLKEKLWNHISQPVGKTGKTQLQLNSETKQNSQLVYALLDLLDFDISKLEKQVKSKVTADIKKQLNKYTDSRAKVSQGGDVTAEKDKDAEEYFSAFK